MSNSHKPSSPDDTPLAELVKLLARVAAREEHAKYMSKEVAHV